MALFTSTWTRFVAFSAVISTYAQKSVAAWILSTRPTSLAEKMVCDAVTSMLSPAACAPAGTLSVTWLPTMYKKIKFGTHENVGWGEIHLPESTMHTTGYWITFPEDTVERLRDTADRVRSAEAVLDRNECARITAGLAQEFLGPLDLGPPEGPHPEPIGRASGGGGVDVSVLCVEA